MSEQTGRRLVREMGSLPEIGSETQLELIMNDFIAATATAAETHTTTSTGEPERSPKRTPEEWAATGRTTKTSCTKGVTVE